MRRPHLDSGSPTPWCAGPPRQEDEFRDAVRAEWGQKGVIDLTLALQMGRMFPMVKAGLGYAKECRRVAVGGNNVDVVKQAA